MVGYDGKSLSINKAVVRRKFKNTTKTNKSRRVLLTGRTKTTLNAHHTRFKKTYSFLTQLMGLT